MSLFFNLPSRMEDLALFTRHMAGAMQARAPLPQILRAYVRDAERSPLTKALPKMADRIESGVELSAVLEEYPRIFPSSYRRLVRLGEQGRSLAGVMSRLADQLEDGLKTYEYLRRVAIYPLIVLIVLFLNVSFLLTKILPKFADIYTQLGADPLLLRSVRLFSVLRPQAFSQLVLELFGLLLLIPILFLIAALFGLRVNGVVYGRFALQLPLIGAVLRRAETARFTGHLALLLENRIPLAEALGLMADASENLYVRAVIQDFHARYQRGERLSELMAAQPLFPATVTTIVAAAEDQGGLGEALHALGRFYAERTAAGLTIVREVFEPIVLILIGLLVGFVLISLYWPLFSIVKIMPAE